MKMRFNAFMVAPVLALSFSNALAFEYAENFEGLNKGVKFTDTYNSSVSATSPVIFDGGVPVVSLDDPIPGITETIPPLPDNPKIVAEDPGAGRSGDAVKGALMFPYQGDPDLADDAWQEQRFKINSDYLPAGEKGLTEIWMQYDQYIPANYTQRDVNPTYSDWYGGPRKVLALYGDGYSKPYPTYVLEAHYKRRDEPGVTVIPDASYAESEFMWTTGAGERKYFQKDGFAEDKFIVDPRIEKGHWSRRTLHLKLPTSESSNDGVIELWIQRLVDTANPVVDKVISISDGNFYDPVRPYLNGGYLMGYSNLGFTEDTTFLIDNFILSDDVNSIDFSAIDPNAVAVYPPNSPSSVSAN